jgi:hypothetical protein
MADLVQAGASLRGYDGIRIRGKQGVERRAKD